MCSFHTYYSFDKIEYALFRGVCNFYIWYSVEKREYMLLSNMFAWRSHVFAEYIYESKNFKMCTYIFLFKVRSFV